MTQSDIELEKTNQEEPTSTGNTSPGMPPGVGNVEPHPQEEPRWSKRRVAFFAVLWVVGAVLLTVVSFQASKFAEFPGDVSLTKWVQQLHQPVLVHIINFASDANWPYPAGAIAISVIVIFLLFRRFRAALCAFMAAFGADLANVTLNSIVARPRPNDTQVAVVAHLGLHSYPSGHVTHVIAFYGFLLYLSIRTSRAHPKWRLWLLPVQLICGYMIVFVGPSRVLEGEHWPSDVLAGYLLGGLMLIAAIALYHWVTIWWQQRQHRTQVVNRAAVP